MNRAPRRDTVPLPPESWFRRWARGRGAVHVFHTPVGVKATHQPVKHIPVAHLQASFPRLELPASSLRLGFDGLRDAFTIVDQPLADSPHRQLMGDLEAGVDLSEGNYLHRLRSGTLDLREAKRFTAAQAGRLAAKFLVRKREAQEGRLAPVLVYQVQGQWHVADGKHRAAMLHLLGLPVPALDVSSLSNDSFYWMLRDRMAERPADHARNLAFFDRMAVRA